MQEILKNNLYDLSNLDFLKKELANKRIVMLGEPDHGAGKAFEIQIEIIKYLHQELGFNVGAFESDFYMGNLTGDNQPDYLYAFWRADERMKNFFHWCNQASLSVTGFDCRKSGAFNQPDIFEQYVLAFKEMLNRTEKNVASRGRFIKILEELLSNEYQSTASFEDKEYFLHMLDELVTDDVFYKQEVKNLYGFAQNAWCENLELSKYRDKQMADNLMWLLDVKYPNEKIVVWAHNFHIQKSFIETASENVKDDIGHLMGEILAKRFCDKLFAIAITAYGGEYSSKAYKGSYVELAKIEYDLSGCIEENISISTFDNAYLSLATRRDGENKFKSSALYLGSPMLVSWENIFDGIIYIRTMNGIKE
jgi:erythromycin esterase